jgi:hypothetical protein
MKTQPILLMVVFLISSNSFAGEGGYLIKSTPTDVKVYIDDKLHAEQTPYTVILPEGKHIVRIEKEGKQTITKEILISNNGVIKDDLKLLDIPPPCAQPANFEELLSPKRGAFEKQNEYLSRLQVSVRRHNECARLADSRYIVGTAVLEEKNYNIDTQEFQIVIHWHNETINKEIGFCKTGVFKANRDDAQVLYEKGKEHPIFLYFSFSEQTSKVNADLIFLKGEKQNKFYNVAIKKFWSETLMANLCVAKDF